MKKWIALVLAAVMTCGMLVGCGDKKGDEANKETPKYGNALEKSEAVLRSIGVEGDLGEPKYEFKKLGDYLGNQLNITVSVDGKYLEIFCLTTDTDSKNKTDWQVMSVMSREPFRYYYSNPPSDAIDLYDYRTGALISKATRTPSEAVDEALGRDSSGS